MEKDEEKHVIEGNHPFSLYATMWKKGLDFDSKSQRSEFAWAMIVHSVILAFLIVISHIETTIGITEDGIIGSLLFIFYFLISYVPAIALARRRLRDLGRGGGALWLLWLPFAGWIALLVLLLLKN